MTVNHPVPGSSPGGGAWEISSGVEHLLYTQIVTSSILVFPIMNYPIIFKNVLPVKDFISMQDELKDWVFSNRSDSETEDQSKVFFGQQDRRSKMTFCQASTTISLKIKRYLKEDLKLIRLHSGGKLFGTRPEFHKDYKELDKCYTFILFANTNWNTNWGGEFIAQEPESSEYKYVSYIPNNGVLIPSHWQHTGSPPLTPEAGIRKTVAFMYTPQSNYKNFCELNPTHTII